MNDLDYRQELARELLSDGLEPNDLKMQVDPAALIASAGLAADLHIPFPPALIPQPKAINRHPTRTTPCPRRMLLRKHGRFIR